MAENNYNINNPDSVLFTKVNDKLFVYDYDYDRYNLLVEGNFISSCNFLIAMCTTLMESKYSLVKKYDIKTQDDKIARMVKYYISKLYPYIHNEADAHNRVGNYFIGLNNTKGSLDMIGANKEYREKLCREGYKKWEPNVGSYTIK